MSGATPREAVRDAVRHMQDAEAARNERVLLADFKAHLPKAERGDIEFGLRDVLANSADHRGLSERSAGEARAQRRCGER